MMVIRRLRNSGLVYVLLMVSLLLSFNHITNAQEDATPEVITPVGETATPEPTLTFTPEPTQSIEETAIPTPLPTETAVATATVEPSPTSTETTIPPTEVTNLTPIPTDQATATATATVENSIPLVEVSRTSFDEASPDWIIPTEWVVIDHPEGKAIQWLASEDTTSSSLHYSTGTPVKDAVLTTHILSRESTFTLGVRVQADDPTQGYFVRFEPNGTVTLWRGETMMRQASWLIGEASWLEVSLMAIADQVVLKVNGVETIRVTDANPYAHGRVELQVATTPDQNGIIRVDDLLLQITQDEFLARATTPSPTVEVTASPTNVVPTATPDEGWGDVSNVEFDTLPTDWTITASDPSIITHETGQALQVSLNEASPFSTLSYHQALTDSRLLIRVAQRNAGLTLGLRVQANNPSEGYFAQFEANGQVIVRKGNTTLNVFRLPSLDTNWHEVAFAVRGDEVRLGVDGIEYVRMSDSTPLVSGGVQVFAQRADGLDEILRVDGIRLQGTVDLTSPIPTVTPEATATPIEDTMDAQGATDSNIPDGYILVGDMLLPEAYVNDVSAQATYAFNKWDNGIIPYTFHSNVSTSQRNIMLAAMQEWENKTVIDFVPRTSQANYIEIFNGVGNWSYIGKINGKQPLSMQDWYHYIALHELGHAIGLWHEQSRPDRDQYVEIIWGNIPDEVEGNFDKHTTAGTFGAYDFESIMHYFSTAFSSNGGYTIVAKSPYTHYQNLMGMYDNLSILDGYGVDYLYAATPPAPTLVFPNSNSQVNVAFLGWMLPNYSAYVTYEVQVDNQSTFASPEFTTNNLLDQGISITTLTDGTYNWRVRAMNLSGATGAWSASRTFIVDTVAPTVAPSLSAPVNGFISSATKPAFSWGSVTGASSYRIQIANNPDFTDAFTQVVTTTSFTPTTPLGQGTKYWRVLARDIATNEGPYSTSRTVVINLQTAPAHNTFFQTATKHAVPFTWAAFGTTGVPYILEVASDEAFANVIFTRNTTTTSYTLSALEALPHGNYWWRVRVNSETLPAEVKSKFTVSPVTPPVPTLTTPATGFNSPLNEVTLAWTLPAYAFQVTYEIQVDNQTTFATPEYNPPAVSGLTTTTTTLADGTYNWRVRSVNAYGLASAWSAVRTFVVDTAAPTVAPTLSAPVNGFISSSTKPAFSWGAVTGASSYRIQIANNPDFTDPFTQVVTTTSFTPTTPLGQGTKYWRVLARDLATNEGPYSTARTVVINLQTAPAHNSFFQTATKHAVPFTWAAFGTTGVPYILEVASDEAFANVIFTRNTTTTSYTLSALEALPHGNYWWRVRVNSETLPAEVKSKFTVSPVTPPVPTQTTPITGFNSPLNTVALAWTLPAYAFQVTYEIQVDNQTTFATPEYNPPAVSGLTTTTTTLADGTYNWRVRSVNAYGLASAWSASQTFIVDTVAPNPPNLLSPVNSAVLTTLRPALTWSASPTAVRYEVRYGNDSSFSRAIVVATTSTSYTFTSDLSNSLYWWSVRAFDGAGNASTWSDARSFTPRSSVGSALITCRSTSPNLTLTWERVSWATQYEYQVSTLSTFATIISSGFVNTGESIPNITTGELGNGRYYWRVRAQASNNTWGAWSTTISCSVDAP